MAVSYTSIAKVRARATDYASSPPDASVEYLIYHAEGIVDAITAFDWRTKFTADSTKYYLIEQVVTDLAAAWLIASDPSITTTNSEAALMIDVFWASANRGLKMLSDPRMVEYLKSL